MTPTSSVPPTLSKLSNHKHFKCGLIIAGIILLLIIAMVWSKSSSSSSGNKQGFAPALTPAMKAMQNQRLQPIRQGYTKQVKVPPTQPLQRKQGIQYVNPPNKKQGFNMMYSEPSTKSVSNMSRQGFDNSFVSPVPLSSSRNINQGSPFIGPLRGSQ
jgi:hypothetical protein